jgi:phosphatidylserine/phosphatidylglycerophosphate/cardiolipin synthase-like enzyme
MDHEAWTRLLRESLQDRKLATAESRAIDEWLGSQSLDERELSLARHVAFEIAGEGVASGEQSTLEWLEGVVKRLGVAAGNRAPTSRCDAFFSPQDDCVFEIIECIRGAQRTIDVCVFTVTDDRISDNLLEAHRSGLAIRLISDDDKSGDVGSDVMRFMRSGLEVRLDRSMRHMHHKFAIFDGRLLLNGSYNWTRGASEKNYENFVVTDEPRLLAAFGKEFERLWHSLG